MNDNLVMQTWQGSKKLGGAAYWPCALLPSSVPLLPHAQIELSHGALCSQQPTQEGLYFECLTQAGRQAGRLSLFLSFFKDTKTESLQYKDVERGRGEEARRRAHEPEGKAKRREGMGPFPPHDIDLRPSREKAAKAAQKEDR